jgi:hypothetical protein
MNVASGGCSSGPSILASKTNPAPLFPNGAILTTRIVGFAEANLECLYATNLCFLRFQSG